MTHFYNYHYPVPDHLKEACSNFLCGTDNKELMNYLNTLEIRKCSIHGELPISVGYYGIRAQCLKCTEPDEEEKLNFNPKTGKPFFDDLDEPIFRKFL